MSILYNPSKVNKFADSLNRLYKGTTTHVEEEKAKIMHRLACLGVKQMDFTEREMVVTNGAEVSLESSEIKARSRLYFIFFEGQCS